MDVHLVEQAGPEELPAEVGTHQADVLPARGLRGPVKRVFDATGDEGIVPLSLTSSVRASWVTTKHGTGNGVSPHGSTPTSNVRLPITTTARMDVQHPMSHSILCAAARHRVALMERSERAGASRHPILGRSRGSRRRQAVRRRGPRTTLSTVRWTAA
jgi:hypothetical protein